MIVDWEKLKPKRIIDLEKENTDLHNKIFKLEDEITDLKNQLSSSDLIISEYESGFNTLKAEVKELYSQQYNNSSLKNRTEINNCPVTVHNERGAGRKSRVDENTLELIKTLKNQGLSHQKIAKRLTETTKKPWSKSTIGYILRKSKTSFHTDGFIPFCTLSVAKGMVII